MNLFYIVLWQLIITASTCKLCMTSNNITTDGISRKLRNIHEEDFQILTLKLKINGKSKIINLTPTSQLLANEHLPVWISSKRGDKLRKLHDDGIVDIKYKIEGLPIDKLHEEHVISSGIFDVLKIKKYFRKHSKKTVCTPEFQADESLKLEIYPELLVAISHD
ncbi:hypothetical protein PV326_001690, partial [Microctonus aethiopoides]